MTEGRLRARVAAYAREENWAPRYVADELAATHDQLRQREHDATVWTARADTATPTEAGQLRDAAATTRTEAEQLRRQVAQLELADDARTAWWIETAVSRDNAHRARYTLALRGIDPDNPADRTTAAEWLDAEHAAREADDPHRDIHEHDLTPDHAHTEHHTDDRTADREPADIRDSQPDPHERVDPVERRRVPLPDATAAIVDRANSALDEIAQRTQAEAAAAAHAAEREPDEDARRAELARWADETDAQTEQREHEWSDDLGGER